MRLCDYSKAARATAQIENTKACANMLKGKAIKEKEEISKSCPATPNRQMIPDSVSKTTLGKRTLEYCSSAISNLVKQKNHRTWARSILLVCLFIFMKSPSGYEFLSQNIVLPSLSTLRRLKAYLGNTGANDITNLAGIDSICNNYRKSNMLENSDKIVGILSVDAVSLIPHLRIDSNGTVKGLKSELVLDKEVLTRVKQSVAFQEKLTADLKDQTLNNAFVFYFQPLAASLDCFTVHVMFSTCRKANEDQVKMLSHLASLLKSNNFIVKSFAADGDSSYNSLVNQTLSLIRKDTRPIIDLDAPLFSNDPLHLLKRGRYKALSHDIVQLYRTEEPINFTKYKEVLNLPTVVFDNSKLTKMQDSYPLRLFDIANLDLLNDLSAFKEVSYMLPFALLKASLSEKHISIDTRVDFLEIIIWYLQFFKEILEKAPGESKAKLQGKGCVVLFDTRITNDIIVTCAVLNSIINAVKGTISLNRIGSNPLEHHFGLMRIRSKYNDDIEHYINSEKESNILENIEKEILGNIVSKRTSSFGEVINVDGIFYGGSMEISRNKDIAFALCKFYGLPVKYLLYKPACCEVDLAYDVFWNRIKLILLNREEKEKKTIVNSKDLSYSSSAGSYITKRFESARILKPDAKCYSPKNCEKDNYCRSQQ